MGKVPDGQSETPTDIWTTASVGNDRRQSPGVDLTVGIPVAGLSAGTSRNSHLDGWLLSMLNVTVTLTEVKKALLVPNAFVRRGHPEDW